MTTKKPFPPAKPGKDEPKGKPGFKPFKKK